MKIKCKNFGPLDEFETNLDADFVLIVGENNIGKSYAISLLYAVLKTISAIGNIPYWDRYAHAEVSRQLQGSRQRKSSARDEFLKAYRSNKKDLPATEVVREVLCLLLQTVFVDNLAETLSGTFGDISNLENRRNNGPTEVSISTDSLRLDLKVIDGNIHVADLSLPDNLIYRKSQQHRQPVVDRNGNHVFYGPTADEDGAISAIVYYASIIQMEFFGDASHGVSAVHYLPASRSGLYQALSAFGQIIAELSKSRTFLARRIELPGISAPLVDYFLNLNDIRPSTRRGAHRTVFGDIADLLDTTVLKGTVEFDQKSKRLFYSPFDIQLRLDLSSTSSMVSEVAPISAYIRHVLPEREGRRRYPATKRSLKQMLFIEEPEAHLHPATQLALMDVFAKMVRETNVKIVMTSHSNFVFNKISNLVMAKGFGQSMVEAFKFEQGERGTRGRLMEVDEYGVTDENFSEVAETIFEEKLELIDKIDYEEDDEEL